MVGRPELLIDVVTVFHTVPGTGNAFTEPTVTPTVLAKVRLAIGSGSRTVDAMGNTNARKAILYWMSGISTTDGNFTIPDIAKDDKVVEGTTDSLNGVETFWTISGIIPAKGATLHHLEVSLV